MGQRKNSDKKRGTKNRKDLLGQTNLINVCFLFLFLFCFLCLVFFGQISVIKPGQNVIKCFFVFFFFFFLVGCVCVLFVCADVSTRCFFSFLSLVLLSLLFFVTFSILLCFSFFFFINFVIFRVFCL